MNIVHLKILVAVVEYGSFSEAALQLGISQSSVSRAIASLEDNLGVSLVARGRFGAYPTSVGSRILDHAIAMLRLQNQIEAEANRAKNLYGGRVRIASFRSVSTHILPSLIAQFCRRFPSVEVALTEADPNTIETALRSGQADIGMMSLPRTSDEFETWDILEDEFVALLPPTDPNCPDPISWQELNRHAFILYNYAECTSVVRSHWQQWGHTLEVAHEIREDSTIVSMVSQGLGAAILPKLAAIPIPDQVQVRSLPVPLARRIGAAILKQVDHSPAVFAFIDLLKSAGVFRLSSDSTIVAADPDA